jgi:hypothetical protein
MKRYLITMGIRTGCFIAAWLVEGPMRWAFFIGAAALPYIAVVLANAVGPRWGSRITGLDRFDDSTHVLGSAQDDGGPAVDARSGPQDATDGQHTRPGPPG